MSCKIYGMIHLQALPGTPKNRHTVKEIRDRAVEEAELLIRNGVDGIIIENMHDIPYLNRQVGPEIVSSMTVVANAIRLAFPKAVIGIQVLAGANKEALAIAHSSQLDFIRAEGFVFSHVADEGLMHSDAAELLRYRKMIGADDIKVYCDIKKKHSAHTITSDVSIAETAMAAKFFLSDGLILTGSSTGVATSVEELKTLRALNTGLPILIGSGVTEANVQYYLKDANILIIGSHFKKDGIWSNPLDEQRIRSFMNLLRNP